jgi:hypothetical protein
MRAVMVKGARSCAILRCQANSKAATIDNTQQATVQIQYKKQCEYCKQPVSKKVLPLYQKKKERHYRMCAAKVSQTGLSLY